MLTITDGHHIRKTVVMLRNESSFLWTGDRLHVQSVSRKDGCDTKEADDIKLRQVANTSTVIARKGTSFVSSVKEQIIHFGAPQLQYKMKLESMMTEGYR